MELKKNPEVEVGRFGSLYFQVGLSVIMLLVYLALEYKSYRPLSKPYETVSYDVIYDTDFEEEIPVMTVKTPATAPPPIPMSSEGIKIVDDDVMIEETQMESTEMTQLDVIGEVIENHTPILRVDDIKVKEVEEDVEIPFAIIESVPIFPGCEKGTKKEITACFEQKLKEHIAEHFVYPKLAKEMGIYGRVYVLFAIDKHGYVSNIQTRGPDKILEDEAERIIKLLPKMVPGKQRGKPTKVTYSLPMYFKYVRD